MARSVLHFRLTKHPNLQTSRVPLGKRFRFPNGFSFEQSQNRTTHEMPFRIEPPAAKKGCGIARYGPCCIAEDLFSSATILPVSKVFSSTLPNFGPRVV